VIFVTVGSDLPFNRLVKHLDHWSRDHPSQRVFAQVGRLKPSDYVPETIQWVQMLTAARFDQHCCEARLIVAHAGMGSIISALAAGKPIVILPRSARLRETRSDHQFATAERYADRPGIFVAWSEADVADAIGRALAQSDEAAVERLPEFAPVDLTNRLRQWILYGRRRSL
jgi:UDP-N-acetylglucosamine transferase subunit ALG13